MRLCSLVDVSDIFNFFLLGRAKGESEAPGRGRDRFFIENPRRRVPYQDVRFPCNQELLAKGDFLCEFIKRKWSPLRKFLVVPYVFFC